MTKKITDILKKKKFTVSAELVPPINGTDPQKIYDKIRQLKGKVDFISVTKGAGGSLRGGTLPISYFAQERYGIDSIAHFVCREHTVAEIENDLVDLNDFNIKNILALRGDPPAGSDEGWSGDYRYAYQLVKQVQRMNSGCYMPRKGEKDCHHGMNTDFCIIVAGHPEDPIKDEIRHMKKKIIQGAEVIITQMVFSFEDYKNYHDSLRKAGITIPIIPGIRPLTSIDQALSTERFFKIEVPDELKKGLEEKGEKYGIRYFKDMLHQLKGYAPGAHFFILNDIGIFNKLIR